MHSKIKFSLLSLVILMCGLVPRPCCANGSANQTPTISPVHTTNELPFRVMIEQDDFSLPNGIHSFASAIYKDKWLFIAGRTNGLHGFSPTDDNFPPQQQNTVVYVVDPINKTLSTRSLSDPTSGLTQFEIDSLSVTSPQSDQKDKTLYITGGYGVNTATGQFATKDTLTAIDIPGLIHWVENPSKHEKASDHIRQIHSPVFQVTGGYMAPSKNDLTLLVFGQNFTGFYSDGSNGEYIEQVRRFKIIDDGKKLSVKIKDPKPTEKNPNYRRRDLNVVPIIQKSKGLHIPGYIAFSGVFTENSGIWTIPVVISPDGEPSMANPLSPKAFKQGMNNYVCPTVGLFSNKHDKMYVVFFGGISYGFFQNGIFQTDSEIPFINQVTTVQMDSKGFFKQYLMDAEYPVILSTGVNPGNPLLFGAGAAFMPVDLPAYKNGVLKLDHLGKKPLLLGYIVGGIQSTLPNTNDRTDSSASPYIFRVILEPL